MFRSRRVHEDEEWEGVVDGKSRNMPDGSNLYHYLKVTFTGGGSKKIRVDGSLWNSVSEGDRIVKRAGSDPAKK